MGTAWKRLLVVVLLALVTTGCASGGDGATDPGGDLETAGRWDVGEEAPGEGGASEPAGQGSAAPSEGGVAGAELEAIVEFRKIVRNAELTIVAEDSESALAAIEEQATLVGGYVADADITARRDRPEGTIVLRVPASRLDEVIRAVEANADRVQHRAVSSADRTDEYTDTGARLRNLQTLERELLVLLREVRERPESTPEDILTIYDRINPIREQIEQLQSQLAAIDELVDLSTLTVHVTLPPQAAATPPANVDEPTPASVALSNAWNALLRALKLALNVVIWLLVYVLPIVLVIFGPFAIAGLLVTRARRHRGQTVAPPAG